MKLEGILLAVTNMEESKRFYRETLGLRVIADFGANIMLTGGLCLQTSETWAEFIDSSVGELGWCGRVSEVYFEEDDFDTFAKKLQTLGIHYVHPSKNMSGDSAL